MTDGLDDDPRDGGVKGPDAFRTISEVAEELGLPQHVLRFWETRFPQIKPIKRGGGRRYYRPGDVELLRGVKKLLYGEGYTIRGVQRILREQGGRKLAQAAGLDTGRPAAPAADPDFYAPRRDVVRDVVDEDDDAPIGPIFAHAHTPQPNAAAPVTPAVSAPTAPTEIPVPQHGLSETQTRRLASALDELIACRRLLGGLT
ncbi:MerR family transcriptional regulator [Methylopila sp. M107]|uniref:MerR family transcriptional regulator n=1 Tax=Methylopila sp. M107 TaxID=1101190 RepID=UPI00036D45F0|nr:MerR family transcriptional regulator [Methylopila sp. M107]